MARRSKEARRERGNFKLNLDVEVPVEHHERMKMAMYACGLKSFAELINHSFSVLEWAMLETIKGNQIAAVAPDGEHITLLDAPSMRNVEKMRDKMREAGSVEEV